MAKKKKKNPLEKFVKTCIFIFEAFEHEISLSKHRGTLWHFTTVNSDQSKKYAIFCAPDLGKSRALIKVATKKVPAGTRLVVVCASCEPNDLENAENNSYTIVEMNTLRSFGEEMLELKGKVSKGPDGIVKTNEQIAGQKSSAA